MKEQKNASFATNFDLSQARKDVQKDIWFSNDHKRLHFKILCDHSSLSLQLSKNKIHLKENLQNLECFLHEIGSEQFRHFKAKNGYYTHPDHRFFSHQVQIAFYQTKENMIPKSLDPNLCFLTGFSEEMIFHIRENEPQISALHLKAKIFSKKGPFE